MLSFDKKIKQSSLDKFKQKNQQRNQHDQSKLILLKSWERAMSQKKIKIVHSISAAGGLSTSRNEDWMNSPFYKNKVSAETLFSSWDVISTTALTFVNDIVYGGTALEIALVLDVPVQNIIGTHLRDVWFNNFAGLEGDKPDGKVIDKSALSKNILGGISKNSHGFKMSEPYNVIKKPDLFVRECFKSNNYYNEILLVGRSGLKMYPSLPPTENIKVSGIFYEPKKIKITGVSKTNSPLLRNTVNRLARDLGFIRNLMVLNKIKEIDFPFINPNLINLNNKSPASQQLLMILDEYQFEWVKSSRYRLKM